MMGPRRAKMIEDKRLRDAARALVTADIENLKSDLAMKSPGARLADRLAEGASEVYDEALDVARHHKGALAAIGAAMILSVEVEKPVKKEKKRLKELKLKEV